MHLKQRPAQLQHPDQVGPHPRRRRGAEGHQGHPGAEAPQLAQAPVVGPEIVAPGADAVGLIHGQPHQVALVLDFLQQAARRLPLQALGGQIEQAQPVIAQAAQELAAAGRIQTAVETGRLDAAALQVQHLVLHQGHQGRHHQHQPLTHQGRELITERFAGPCGQHRQAIASLQERFHHGPLPRPKLRPAEMALQGLEQGIGLVGLGEPV